MRAVIVESFERIHRSNLIGMGVLPLQFQQGENIEQLGLDGTEIFDIKLNDIIPRGMVTLIAKGKNDAKTIEVLVRIDTPKEMEYFKNGGILHYVLRQLATKD